MLWKAPHLADVGMRLASWINAERQMIRMMSGNPGVAGRHGAFFAEVLPNFWDLNWDRPLGRDEACLPKSSHNPKKPLVQV